MSFLNIQAVEFSSSPPCRQFTLSEIELATQNFDESLVIGSGGFGKVYKGSVACGEVLLDAAIKRLESGSSQGEVEFWAEVERLSELRHCHLVSLIGYCHDSQEMILVYEYMPNGTLADHLHKRRAPLTWVRRLKICIGAARGLDYLHTGTGIKSGIIHRDVKSTNILLDKNCAAKISDFGLSKIGPTNQPSTYVNTSVRGTFGYLDPDYFLTGRLTRKSDVYAFGVMLFEVLCGKQAVDRSIGEKHEDHEEHWGNLARWAQDYIKEGRLKQLVDSNIDRIISPKCLKEFALLADRCVHSRPKQRPTMAEVVVGLESILALQEKTDSTMFTKLFGKSVHTIRIPPNWENLVGCTSLKSLDQYLYTIGGEDRIVHRFDFNTIVYATKNFSRANKLSSDRYTSMYKGRLKNGKDVTIYRPSSSTRYETYMNEASVLVKVEHENVVQLLGYCINGTNLYLLYDFAPHATLDELLFDPMCDHLDCNRRYNIILGIANILVDLHKQATIQIIHGDVKPGNILLDVNFNPRLSGFGLATTINNSEYIHVDKLRGTLGYMAPEYLWASRMSTKAEVFSFGVLVLETVTGKRIFDLTRDGNPYLFYYVQRNCLEGTLSDLIDPRIDVNSILMTKLVEIGLLCVQKNEEVRPTMEEVVGMLLGTISLTLPVSKMRSRMNGEPQDLPLDLPANLDRIIDEDYETTVEEFRSELCPR